MPEAAATEAPKTGSDAAAVTPAQVAGGLQMGDGVPRAAARPEERQKVKAQNLKAKPTVWHAVPQYPGQMQNTDEVRQTAVEVHVLDLSNSEHLIKYQALLNLELQDNANRFILNQERRYDEKGARFLVYVEVGVFEFKEFLPPSIHGKPN